MKKNVNFVAHRHMEAVAPTVPRQSIVMVPVVTNAAGVAQHPWAVAAYTVHLRSMKNESKWGGQIATPLSYQTPTSSSTLRSRK